ncbi:MAG: sporulation transcriptional regulator SpoIIID [Oscillospiraceae bacterium]|nr:sporulation transcriptional regulator SpoIIID [Oscillospiraceae bacterium]
MTDTIDKRARELAEYVLQTGATVRAAAERFGVSKSTVHKDLTRRLEQSDRLLFLRVRAVLDRNKAQRHLRGGAATRRKYALRNAGAARKKIDKRPKNRHNI